MAEKTVDSYQTESEREALQESVLAYQLGKNTSQEGIEDSRLGETLVDRVLENSSTWDIVVENGNEGNPYGTDWNLVEEGTDLGGYGKAQNDWLVNYETGEIKELKDDSYEHYDFNSTVAVTDGLLFNLDSANVGLDRKSWGNKAKLYYYDKNTYSTVNQRKAAYENQKTNGIVEGEYDRIEAKNEEISNYIDDTTGAFKFNGNNYIEIDSGETSFDFSNGLTFEFYGNITGGVCSLEKNWIEDSGGEFGVFCFWNSNPRSWTPVRLFHPQSIGFCASLCTHTDPKTHFTGWAPDDVRLEYCFSPN